MIWNFIKSTYRNLSSHKTYSYINILGLAIGIASFLITYLFISDELSYDRFHENADNIYRLVNVYDFDGVGENSASAPFPVAFTLKNDYPTMIKNIVRVFNFQAPRSFVEVGEKKFNEKYFFFADSTFFDIFDYNFVQGNEKTALDENGAVVITRSAARKYFGNEDPMGKTIRFETRLDLQVTGVIEDVPSQSHFRFDFIGSMSTLRELYGGKLPQTWVWNPCWTYLLLEPNVNPQDLEKEFPAFVQKYFFDAEKDNVSMYLQPLLDIHLKSKLDYEIASNNHITSIYILSVIAIFLLVIAIINYMNMATATSSRRAKEIGIRKVAGAYRGNLVRQFIGESIFVSFIAMIIALLIAEFLIPVFNDLTSKDIVLTTLLDWQNVLNIILLWFFIGLLAGIYPALYLSTFNPIKVLKGSLSLGTKSGLARKVLVVIQFTISISLIIGTIVINDQLDYMKYADLGFDKENVLVIPINRTPVARSYDSFKKELLNNSNIISVTAMDDIFGSSHNTHEFRPEGFPEDQWQFYPAMVVKYDFVKTFKIKLLAGRDYHEANKTDPLKGILINESMVRHMGWSSPEEALGRKFVSLNGEERVIGVFNNFHPTSLHEATGPFVLNMKEIPGEVMWFLKYMVIRIQPGSEKQALMDIESLWNKTAPERPFDYFFLNDELENLYQDEENLGSLSFILTLLVLFIAALGLLGLASFLAEQKTKEIGIRKVLGASVLSIIKNISREFIWLILLASVFAWVIAYVIVTDWLNHFPYQVDLNWLAFFFSAVFAIGLALLITSFRAIMASKADPVDTLKYE